jgi:hypothetical protein
MFTLQSICNHASLHAERNPVVELVHLPRFLANPVSRVRLQRPAHIPVHTISYVMWKNYNCQKQASKLPAGPPQMSVLSVVVLVLLSAQAEVAVLVPIGLSRFRVLLACHVHALTGANSVG